ncbi:Phytochelatin synthase [Fragilaria crotonensis]|nr:Phytochelatin synthase [Fragilaria crotonensis]
MNRKNYQSILPEHQPLVAPASRVDDRSMEEERHDSRLGLFYVLVILAAIVVSVRVAYSRGSSSQPTIVDLNQEGIEEESKLFDKTRLHDRMFESVDAQFDRMDEWKRRIADIWGPFWNETNMKWNEYKDTLHQDSQLIEEKTRGWWKNFAEQTAEWWNETTLKAAHFIDAENKRTSEWLKHEQAKPGSGAGWWNETTKRTEEFVDTGKERTSEWWNATEQKLDGNGHKSIDLWNKTEHKTADWIGKAGHKSTEWFNKTEHGTAGWLEDKEHSSAEWLNGTVHGSAGWLSDEERKSAEWLNETGHESADWLSDEEHKTEQWWNRTGHDVAAWLNDEQHKTAEWWNETERKASSWVKEEEYASGEWWNETEHETGGWFNGEEERIGVWWNTTEQKATAWFHHVDDLIEHTVDRTAESWNETDHKIEDWWYNVTHRHKELPEFVIYLNTTDAYRMLAHGGIAFIDFAHDYFLIQQGFDAQINQAYCAVATSAAILNSFRGDIELPIDPIYNPHPYATQADMFNHCTNSHVIRRNASFDGIFKAPGGLSMLQTKALLECHLDKEAWNVSVHHVDPFTLSIEDFRRILQQALANTKARVMINFDRKGVGQAGGGHFSPLGAFSPVMDAFLVMDVAKYKYPNAWVSTSLLYKSLQTLDACGKWDFPRAQDVIPPEYLNAKTELDYMSATVMLGCESTRRGFITIEKIV